MLGRRTIGVPVEPACMGNGSHGEHEWSHPMSLEHPSEANVAVPWRRMTERESLGHDCTHRPL
jgi:hypothetical protein